MKTQSYKYCNRRYVPELWCSYQGLFKRREDDVRIWYESRRTLPRRQDDKGCRKDTSMRKCDAFKKCYII